MFSKTKTSTEHSSQYHKLVVFKIHILIIWPLHILQYKNNTILHTISYCYTTCVLGVVGDFFDLARANPSEMGGGRSILFWERVLDF